MHFIFSLNILCAFKVYDNSITSKKLFKQLINNQIRSKLSDFGVILIFKKFVFLYLISLSILSFFFSYFYFHLYYALNLFLPINPLQNPAINVTQLNFIHNSFQIYCQPSIYLFKFFINFFFFCINV